MMKDIVKIGLASIGLVLMTMQGYGQEKYAVTGKISGWPTETVYLVRQGNYPGVDSVQTQDGSFAFKGTIEGPTVAYLITAKKGGVAKFLYVEPGDITVQGAFSSLQDVDVQGSPSYKDYLELKKGHEEINTKAAQYTLQIEESEDDEEIQALNNSIANLRETGVKFSQEFIKSHPQSAVSLAELKSLTDVLENAALVALFKGLNEQVRTSPEGQFIAENLKYMGTDVRLLESN